MSTDAGGTADVRLLFSFALKSRIRKVESASTIWCFHRIALWSDSRSRSSPRLYCPCRKFFQRLEIEKCGIRQIYEWHSRKKAGSFPICFLTTVKIEVNNFFSNVDLQSYIETTKPRCCSFLSCSSHLNWTTAAFKRVESCNSVMPHSSDWTLLVGAHCHCTAP